MTAPCPSGSTTSVPRSIGWWRGLGRRRFDGVLAVGDRPTVIAALVARRLGLRFHAPAGAADGTQQIADARAASSGRPARRPGSTRSTRSRDGTDVSFPCVVKPLDLSGSRGVIRADDPSSFAAACARAGAIVESARREAGGPIDHSRERAAGRGIRRRTRIRGRGGDDRRGPAAPGDLRQAGSARRTLFRRDDLSDAPVVDVRPMRGPWSTRWPPPRSRSS